MFKHRLTTIFATLAGACGALHTAGVEIGHIGQGDFVMLAGIVSATIVGWLAADANKVR